MVLAGFPDAPKGVIIAANVVSGCSPGHSAALSAHEAWKRWGHSVLLAAHSAHGGWWVGKAHLSPHTDCKSRSLAWPCPAALPVQAIMLHMVSAYQIYGQAIFDSMGEQRATVAAV